MTGIINGAKIAIGFIVVSSIIVLFVWYFSALYSLIKYFVDYFCIFGLSSQFISFITYLGSGFCLVYCITYAWSFFRI